MGDGGADLAGEESGDWEAPSQTEGLGAQTPCVRALPGLRLGAPSSPEPDVRTLLRADRGVVAAE